jgi:hypothetical protein
MILRYGTEALRQADQRIRELREHGEEDAVLLWQEIRAAIAQETGDRSGNDSKGKGH